MRFNRDGLLCYPIGTVLEEVQRDLGVARVDGGLDGGGGG